MTVEIKVKALFERGSSDAAVGEYLKEFNKLGDAVAHANKVKFNPVDKAAKDDIARMQAAFNSFVKLQSEFRRRMKATGQGGSGMLDLDWGRMYPRESDRRRVMTTAMEYVGRESGVGGGFSAPSMPPPGGRPPAAPPGPAAPPAPAGGGGGGYGRQALGAGLNAMGSAGAVANRSLSVGMEAGMGAGLGALVGGMAAIAIGGIVKSIKAKIDDAEQEFIGYDTLKRQLGDVNVSFGVLKESLRESARSIDVTFAESLKLGQQFTKLSGMAGEQSKGLGEEVSNSGGFARSFGLDPSQANQFFGQMRLFQATQNSDDSKRMAIMIGEGIAKAGAFSKADEVLQAISSFAAQQTRMGLTTANVGGYAGMFSNMVGARIPGMDPAGASNILGRINSSISGGGDEAWQVFMQRAIGSRMGLDPIETAIMREQGAFGTGAGTFGPGSIHSKWAASYGMRSGSDAARGSSATNIELVMNELDRQYAGKNPLLKINAMHEKMGLSHGQAEGFDFVRRKFGYGSLGSVQQRLDRLGIKMSDVNGSGIASMGKIEASGMSDAAKDTAMRQAAKAGQEKTPGSEIREGLVGIQNLLQDYAGKTVPLFVDMRAGVLMLAGGGKRGTLSIRESVARADSDDRIDQINKKFSGSLPGLQKNAQDADGAYTSAFNDFQRNGGSMNPQQRAAAQAQLATLRAKRDAARTAISSANDDRGASIAAEQRSLLQELAAIRTPLSDNAVNNADYKEGGSAGGRGKVSQGGEFDALFEKYGSLYGVDPDLLKSIGMKESGLNPLATHKNANGTTDYGLMQHNSAYLGSRGITNWRDPEQQIAAAARLMHDNLAATHGDMRAAVARYNGTGPAADAYATDVMSMYNGDGTTPPLSHVASTAAAARSASPAGPQQVNVSGEFILKDSRGNVIGSANNVRTSVGAPTPAGAS